MSDPVQPHRQQPTRLPRPWDSPGKNTGVGCHFLLQCMKVKSESEVSQSCPTLSDPMDCGPPGSSIHGIFQARVLEWGAIAFSAFLSSLAYNYKDFKMPLMGLSTEWNRSKGGKYRRKYSKEMASGGTRGQVLVWFVSATAMPDRLLDFFLEPTNSFVLIIGFLLLTTVRILNKCGT